MQLLSCPTQSSEEAQAGLDWVDGFLGNNEAKAKRIVPGAAGSGLELCPELLYLVAQLLDPALILANALLGLCHLLLLHIQLSLQLPHLQGHRLAQHLALK